MSAKLIDIKVVIYGRRRSFGGGLGIIFSRGLASLALSSEARSETRLIGDSKPGTKTFSGRSSGFFSCVREQKRNFLVFINASFTNIT